MAKAGFVDETSNMSQKEVAAIKGVVEEQKARLDAAGAKMTELKSHYDEAALLTATCNKELLRMQKNLAAAFEKTKGSPGRALTMTRERIDANTKY